MMEMEAELYLHNVVTAEPQNHVYIVSLKGERERERPGEGDRKTDRQTERGLWRGGESERRRERALERKIERPKERGLWRERETERERGSYGEGERAALVILCDVAKRFPVIYEHEKKRVREKERERERERVW